ncbi:MAG: hypothetical protein PHW63_07815 [Alphaproteobacteria bacterium]|nr:hypothetical protein [Alphaproteobacteria bacterium]
MLAHIAHGARTNGVNLHAEVTFADRDLDVIGLLGCTLDKGFDLCAAFIDIDMQNMPLRLVNPASIVVSVIKITGNILNGEKHRQPRSLGQNGERRRIRARAAHFKASVLLIWGSYTSPWMKRLTPPCRHREDPALDAGDVAIQSPSFQQEDWIASSAKASSP